MKPLAASAVLIVATVSTALVLAQAPKASDGSGAKGAASTAARPGAKGEAPTAGDATQGGSIQQCIACHGEQGQGNPQGGIPRIAGQPEAYLRKQLDSYADGSRRNAVMQPIAKALSREARAAGASYYAALAPTAAAGASAAAAGSNAKGTTSKQSATTGIQGASPPASNQGAGAAAGASRGTSARGEELATVGDERSQVQACGNCHGPGGIGEPPGVPYLAGQDVGYLTAALSEFKNGARRNDAGAQMRTVVRGMTAEDIGAVAQYYAARVPPARPAPADIVRAPSEPVLTSGAAAPGPARGGAATSTQSTSSASGHVGSEQGAGTTGGTQGAGGTDQGSRTDKPGPGR